MKHSQDASPEKIESNSIVSKVDEIAKNSPPGLERAVDDCVKNGAKNGVEKSQSLIDLLRYRALHNPDSLAYSFLKDGLKCAQSVTYAELDQQARALASALQTKGQSTLGNRVVLLYSPGIDFIVAFFGSLYGGLIPIPAPPPDAVRLKRTLPRLISILDDAGAGLILSTTDIYQYCNDGDETTKKETLQSRTLKSAVLNTQEQLDEVVWLCSDELIADSDVADSERWIEPPLNKQTLAYLQYTSGSTSSPKGVMLSHGNLLHHLKALQTAWRYTSESISVTWMPHFHDYGLVDGLLEALYAGIPCYILSPVTFVRRPVRWLEAISHYRGTHTQAPNFAYKLCFEKVTAKQLTALDLSCLSVASNGAEPIRAETMRRFIETFAPCGFNATSLYPAYGMAETTLLITTKKHKQAFGVSAIDAQCLEREHCAVPKKEGKLSRELVSCGPAIEGFTVAVVNSDTQARLKEGEVGEIWVSSDSVAEGYWNKKTETEYAFAAKIAGERDSQDFLRTGDLGFLRDGELYVTGRLKDLIVIAGVNHYPQDIEWTVQQCCDELRSDHCAAFSIEVDGQERLVVVGEVIRPLDEWDEFFKKLRIAVSETHEIELFAFAALKKGSILKTSSGKLQRQGCRKVFLDGSLPMLAKWQKPRLHSPASKEPESHQRPINAEDKADQILGLSDWLIQTLAQKLQLPLHIIDPKEPFASYGLTSFIGIQLIHELEQWLGVDELSPTLLWDYPSIFRLSAHLSVAYKSGIRNNSNSSANDAYAEPSRINEANTKQPNVDHSTTNSGASNHQDNAIAIIGMACRLPGANSPSAFWEMLINKTQAVSEVPAGRWDGAGIALEVGNSPGELSTLQGGFLSDVDGFDAELFGIAAHEATIMDPQQRLLLEVGWECLERAGYAPDSLGESDTGVFIGISTDDYSTWQMQDGESISAYTGPGKALSIAANRLSYQFDFTGPSMAIDTACSSSLVSLHQACQSLRNDECSMALAGGVNLLLAPQMSIALSQAGMLASDGRCKTFDASANGYVRGEGCGLLVLKRLDDANRDGDKVLAVIRGSAVNQDGRSNGLTAPNGLAQQRVVSAALAAANVTGNEISYVEAHGTGTSLGDPIEVNSLQQVLSTNRQPQQTCALGAVKANIGHLEAAAGVAGVIKTVLSLQYGEIPPHPSLKKLNPYIKLNEASFHVPTERTEWPKGRRLAGVSSFGFGGTNAHIILEAANPEPAENKKRRITEIQNSWNVLALSAKNQQSLVRLAQRWQHFLKQTVTLNELNAWCSAANRGRAKLDHGVVVRGESPEQIYLALSDFIAGREGAWTASNASVGTPQIAFLFTGQGSQYLGMGRQLYQSQVLFKQIIDVCDEYLSPTLELSIVELLYDEKNENKNKHADSLLTRTDITQPVLFALEYALARLWMSWGLQPKALLGHSLGEYVAACIAGVFSLQDGLRLVAARANLMNSAPGQGGMLGVVADEATIREIVASDNSSVEIAVYNSPQHLVLSGETQVLEKLADLFKRHNIETRTLKVSHGFHSVLMEPILDRFAEVAHSISYHPPTLAVISNLNGELVSNEIASADYWVRHVRNPVRFADGLLNLEKIGIDTYVEIGPGAGLLSLAKLAFGDKACYYSSLRKNIEDHQQIIESVAGLCAQGVALDLHLNLSNREVKPLSHALPVYPFLHKNYRLPKIKQRRASAPSEFPGRLVSSPLLTQLIFENHYSLDHLPWLSEHRVFEKVVVPGAAHLALVLEASQTFLEGSPCVLEDVIFPQALLIPESSGRALHLSIDKNPALDGRVFNLVSFEPDAQSNSQVGRSSKLQVTDPEAIDQHASGRIIEISDPEAWADLDAIKDQCTLLQEDFYQQIWQSAIALGSTFRWVTSIWRGEGQVLAHLQMPQEITSQSYHAHPGLLDSFLQILTAAVPLKKDEALVPFGFDRFCCYGPLSNQSYWSHLQIQDDGSNGNGNKNKDNNNTDNSNNSGEEVISDVRLLSDEGRVLVEVKGFRARRVAGASFLRERGLQDAVYSQQWQKIELEPVSSTGRWLLVGSSSARDWLAAGLLAIGVEVLHADISVAKEAAWKQDMLALSPLEGVLFLATDTDSDPSTTKVNSASYLCDLLVSWVQLLSELSEPTKLVVLTHNAQARNATQLLQPDQSSLWGLARVVRLENPELNCQCIDLDTSTYSDFGVAVHKLVQAIALTEPDVLLSGADTLVPRLQRQAVTIPDSAAFGAEASYVISGGLGALGLRLAEWLIEQGARHLLLLGRNVATVDKQQRIDKMQSGGAHIEVSNIDVSDQQALALTIDSYCQQAPAVSGVFHLAGQLADNVLSELSTSSFEVALSPKLGGALALHQVFKNQSLDYFVCFSSVAALTGSMGQGAYAAANAATDSLMAWRRLQGLAAQSVQWGPWAEAGMAADQNQKDQQRFSGYGIEAINPTYGMAFLSWVLEKQQQKNIPATLVAMPVDWSRYLAHLYGDSVPPMYQALMSVNHNHQSQENALVKVDLMASLKGLSSEVRRSRIEQLLRSAIASIVGLDDDSQIGERKPLFDLGLDSLGAIELRNRLAKIIGRTMRATLLFDFPTLSALSDHLEYDVLGFSKPGESNHDDPDVASENNLRKQTLAQIDELSDDELATMLEQELGDKS